MKLHKDNRQDFDANFFFGANGIINCVYAFVLRKLQKNGITELVPVLTVKGVQPETGLIVETDIWPRDHATAEDLKALPASGKVQNFWFRIGTALVDKLDSNNRPVLDEKGNVVKVPVDSAPKLLGYFNQYGNFVTFKGGKREGYGDDAVLVDNTTPAEPKADAEPTTAPAAPELPEA